MGLRPVESCFDTTGHTNRRDEVDRIGAGSAGVLGSVSFSGVIGDDGLGGRAYIVGARLRERGWGISVDGPEFGQSA